MALEPVTRQSTPDKVFDQILSGVVSGDFAAGEALPSERRLADVLGVSRPTVREALQRLAHAGLVEVRQGGATTVRDFRRHAGLELLPRLLLPQGELDLSVARSILEARLHNGPQVAALAAERSGARLAEPLGDAVAALEADPDPVFEQRHALRFWDHVVDGADSVAFRLMFNSLRLAYEPLLEPLAPLMQAEVGRPEAYRALAEAIAAGDPDAARHAAEDLLRPATDRLLDAIRRLED
ncbi:MAG: GntR family transcriptional regulator [Micromonosporaceae bacterium]|nr:GntR family transcriptional regulator [Micromonosporaceae bacterium]